MNDSNDSIHPFTNGLSITEKIAGSVIFRCRLQASEHVLLLVSNRVSLVRIIVPNHSSSAFSKLPSNTITPSSSKSLQFRFLWKQPCLPHQPRSKILYKGKTCLLLSSNFKLHLSCFEYLLLSPCFDASFSHYHSSETLCLQLALIFTP